MIAAVALTAIATTITVIADSGKPVNERRNAKPDENISINNVAGSIVVTGTGEPELVITGTVAEKMKLEIKQSNGQTSIRVVQEDETAKRWSSNGGTHLQIKLPRGSKVEVSTISADITASNITGRTMLQTVSGEVNTTENIEQLKVKSVSGDIAIGHVTSSLEVETVSGIIKITHAKNLVNAQTVSGDVRINGNELEQLLVRSISGEIDVEGSLTRNAKVRISSHSGDITLEIPATTSGEFKLITRSGEIHNTLTNDRGKTLFMGGEEIEFKIGTGTASVSVESFSGGITMMKN